MSEWKKCKLGDIASFKYGKMPKREELCNKGYPVYSGYKIVGYCSDYMYEDPQLIVVARGVGGTGDVKVSPPKSYITNLSIVIELNSNISKEFLLYYFKINSLRELDSGSAQSQITIADLSNYLISIPPFSEQKAIASILSNLDDKINLLHRNNETLEAMAETIFRQWFVEFQFITAEGMAYKENGGGFYETEFGMIPVSWSTPAISEIIEVKDGTHDSPKPTESGYYLITSRHMKPQGLDFENAYTISEDDYNAINKRSKVERYDILISMIGTLGLIYFVQDKEISFAIKNIGLYKTSQKKEFAMFLYLLLKSNYGKSFLYENTEGSTQEYLALGSLRNMNIIVPNPKVLSKFNNIVDPIFKKIYKNTLQIRTFESLRDTLLPKLITGEIRVPL